MNISTTVEDSPVHGYPVFSPGEDNSFLDGFYRFSAAELERITTIIPSLSQVRPGDLIMRTNDTGETHLGVVVRTNFAGLDSSATSQDYMNSIYLISVNHSLRQVSLATWGNPAGGFGGFSLEPGKFHARRLLKKSETGELSAAGEKPGWELLDEYKVKLRSYYPPETEVPRGYVEIDPDSEFTTIPTQDTSIVKKIVEGKVTINTEQISSNYYHRELPTTSFSYRTSQGILGTGTGTELQPIPSLVTQLSGWRNRERATQPYHYINYHTGVDLTRWSEPISPNDGKNRDVKILSPEDGLFYVWNPAGGDEDNWNNSSMLKLRDSQGELLSDSLGSYSGHSYGLVGVLITHPDNTQKGRVYLFAHLGDEGNSYIEKLPYNTEYSATGQFPPFTTYPDPTHPQTVSAGTPLAYVGSLGDNVPYHIHLEVYEYFSEPDNWFRVDPLSCFHENLYGNVNYGDDNSTYPLYGWWARLLGTYNDEYSFKTEFQSQSDPGTMINTLGNADYSRGWLEAINVYSWQHTWIYFTTTHTYNDGTTTPLLQDVIDEYNAQKDRNLSTGDIFKSDRWDNLREIDYDE